MGIFNPPAVSTIAWKVRDLYRIPPEYSSVRTYEDHARDVVAFRFEGPGLPLWGVNLTREAIFDIMEGREHIPVVTYHPPLTRARMKSDAAKAVIG
jgi:hypothetical protein